MNTSVCSFVMRPNLLLSLLCLLSLAWSATLQAKESNAPFTRFGDFVVTHTVFNSTFINEEVAAAYKLSRARDRALVNVSIVRSGAGSQTVGLPADISGTVTNLMQQQIQLKFMEINEGDAVYYLAPFRVHNEEVLHFAITVTHEGKDYDVKFTKKLYQD